MLPRLNVSADPTLYNLIVDDDLTLIAIQGNAFSRLVFCHDNKVISAERHGALGRTTAHVELAYGKLFIRKVRRQGQHDHFIDLDLHIICPCGRSLPSE